MYPFLRELFVNTHNNLIMAAAEIDGTFHFVISLRSQKYNTKIERSKNLPKCFSLMVTQLYSRFKIYVVFMSQILLLMGKCFIVDRHFLKTSYCSSHKLYITIYLLVHQYLFCVRQANKISTLLSSHFSSAKVEFSVLCF